MQEFFTKIHWKGIALRNTLVFMMIRNEVKCVILNISVVLHHYYYNDAK
jgi:hypothetical protein